MLLPTPLRPRLLTCLETKEGSSMSFKTTLVPTLVIAVTLGLTPESVDKQGPKPRVHPYWTPETLDTPYPEFHFRDFRPQRDFKIPGHPFKRLYVQGQSASGSASPSGSA